MTRASPLVYSAALRCCVGRSKWEQHVNLYGEGNVYFAASLINAAIENAWCCCYCCLRVHCVYIVFVIRWTRGACRANHRAVSVRMRVCALILAVTRTCSSHHHPQNASALNARECFVFGVIKVWRGRGAAAAVWMLFVDRARAREQCCWCSRRKYLVRLLVRAATVWRRTLLGAAGDALTPNVPRIGAKAICRLCSSARAKSFHRPHSMRERQVAAKVRGMNVGLVTSETPHARCGRLLECVWM